MGEFLIMGILLGMLLGEGISYILYSIYAEKVNDDLRKKYIDLLEKYEKLSKQTNVPI